MRMEVQDKGKAGALLCLGCYRKCPLGWVAHKQREFISPRSGGWEVEGQGASRFSVCSKSVSSFCCLLSVSPCDRRVEGTCGVSFIQYF